MSFNLLNSLCYFGLNFLILLLEILNNAQKPEILVS
jgi:hypothetical protein